MPTSSSSPELEPRASAEVDDLTARLERTAHILATVGELCVGDRVITGSVVQEPVGPGDRLTADLEALGTVSLEIVR